MLKRPKKVKIGRWKKKKLRTVRLRRKHVPHHVDHQQNIFKIGNPSGEPEKNPKKKKKKRTEKVGHLFRSTELGPWLTVYLGTNDRCIVGGHPTMQSYIHLFAWFTSRKKYWNSVRFVGKALS